MKLDAAFNVLEELELLEDRPKDYSSHTAFPDLVRVARYASWMRDVLDQNDHAFVCSDETAATALGLLLFGLSLLEENLPMAITCTECGQSSDLCSDGGRKHSFSRPN